MTTNRKYSKILSKNSGQISKYFDTNGPLDTLYQNYSNDFDWFKNMTTRWRLGQYWGNFIFYLKSQGRKGDNSSCLILFDLEP